MILWLLAQTVCINTNYPSMNCVYIGSCIACLSEMFSILFSLRSWGYFSSLSIDDSALLFQIRCLMFPGELLWIGPVECDSISTPDVIRHCIMALFSFGYNGFLSNQASSMKIIETKLFQATVCLNYMKNDSKKKIYSLLFSKAGKLTGLSGTLLLAELRHSL